MSKFFEPWRVSPPRPTPAQEKARRQPCPPEADPEAWGRLGSVKPDYLLVWGTGMVAPERTTSLISRDQYGAPAAVAVPGERIVLTVKPPINDREVTASQLADRIAACVNACEGLGDPVAWVRWARSELARRGKGAA